MAREIQDLADSTVPTSEHFVRLERLEDELRERPSDSVPVDVVPVEPPEDVSRPPAALRRPERLFSSESTAPIEDVLEWVVGQQTGRVTVVGGLGQHLAHRLASRQDDRRVTYRFVYPATSALDQWSNERVDAARLQMLQEGEFKTLAEWKRGIDQRAHENTVGLLAYVSSKVGDACIVMLEPKDGPEVIAYWSESVQAAMTAMTGDAGVAPATVMREDSVDFPAFRLLVEGGFVASARPYRQHPIIVTSCPGKNVKSPAGYPTATRKLFRGFGNATSASASDSDEPVGIPVALVILYGTYEGDRGLWLQRRNSSNSRDAFGTYSLMSTRVYSSDFLAGLNDVEPKRSITLDRDADVGEPSPGTDTDLLYDRMKVAFPEWPEPTPRFPRYPIPVSSFRRAARRECYSSLGIDLPDSRLEHHSLRDGYDTTNRMPPIMVELFSVRLFWEDEIENIPRRRPFAQFVPFDWPSGINDLADKELNGFLRQYRRDPTFREIVDSLW